MKIASVLHKAELADFPACKECPWSPKKSEDVAFGVSCPEHGVNWKEINQANSMTIVQDPADTTPQETGMLCAIHNAKNPTDKTAQQDFELWKATVSLDSFSAETGGYMKSHYWTNAIMHGATSSSGLRKSTLSMARQCCTEVLAFQIMALQPKVVIAKGKVAVGSLYDIGLIKHPWDVLRHEFRKGAYKETVANWRGLKNITVFCTYHTSARVVNQTLSKQYNEQEEIEELIEIKLKALPNKDSIDYFLKKI